MADQIVVGSKVRSFDFADGPLGRDLEGPRASYVEGEVVEIGRFDSYLGDCDRYKIKVSRRVFGGKDVTDDHSPVQYAPVNGTRRMLGGVCDGVELIKPDPMDAVHQCEVCGREATIAVALEPWIPYWFDLAGRARDPICDDCAEKLGLVADESGEMAMADPRVSSTGCAECDASGASEGEIVKRFRVSVRFQDDREPFVFTVEAEDGDAAMADVRANLPAGVRGYSLETVLVDDASE